MIRNTPPFLHYQPERTTLPEGYNFSSQLLVIQKLRAILPKDINILVKEHPSIFTNNFDVRYRNESFYKDISKLDNVQLVPLDCDTFKMIDDAQGIITITGTVGVQALIRKKPVLAFGTASFRNLKGVFFVNEEDDFQAVLNDLLNSKTLEYNEIKEMLQEVAQKSVGSLQLNGNGDEINFYKSESRIDGHIKLLNAFLKK